MLFWNERFLKSFITFWHVWNKLFGTGGLFLFLFFLIHTLKISSVWFKDVQWIQLPLGRFSSEPGPSQYLRVTPFLISEFGLLSFLCVFLWQWENWFIPWSWQQIIKTHLQQCQPLSLKALNSIDLFTLVIYDLPAMCCPLFVFLFLYQPLDSLPCPPLFLIPLQTWRWASLVTPWAPAQSVLHMAYRGADNSQWLLYSPLQDRWPPRLLEYGASRVPSQGRNQSSLLCCASWAALTVPLPLVCFYLILKMRKCSVCCCVNIKYIFIVFQTYIYINAIYIYI